MPEGEFDKLKAQLENEGLGVEATTLAAIAQQASFSATYLLTLRASLVEPWDALELTKHWMSICVFGQDDEQ